MQNQAFFQVVEEQRHFYGRRPDSRSRGRVSIGAGVAGGGGGGGNTTDVIGVGASVSDVIAVDSVTGVIQVGA